MKIRSTFFALLLAVCAGVVQAQTGQENVPIKVTLCDLAEHPERYAGKIVAVHATEMGKDLWIEDFVNKPCSAWTQIIVVYPDRIKPPPGFALVRDDAFN